MLDVFTQEDDYDYWKEKICYRHRFLLVGSELCLQLSSYPVRRRIKKKRLYLPLLLHFPAFPKPRGRGPEVASQETTQMRQMLIARASPPFDLPTTNNRRAPVGKLLQDFCFSNRRSVFESWLLHLAGEEKQHTTHKDLCLLSIIIFLFVTNL